MIKPISMVHTTEVIDASKRLASLLTKHAPVFADRLGKMKNFKASIDIRQSTTPKFCKALEEVVKSELERLENEGVLKSISYSEWASPVVVILSMFAIKHLCYISVNVCH